MRYRFIENHRGLFSIAAMCRVLEVSTSGYYAWRQRAESARRQANRRLLVHIETVFQQSDQTYGSPRIHRELVDGRCSISRSYRLRREPGGPPDA